jgi:hypothetical protein
VRTASAVKRKEKNQLRGGARTPITVDIIKELAISGRPGNETKRLHTSSFNMISFIQRWNGGYQNEPPPAHSIIGPGSDSEFWFSDRLSRTGRCQASLSTKIMTRVTRV